MPINKVAKSQDSLDSLDLTIMCTLSMSCLTPSIVFEPNNPVIDGILHACTTDCAHNQLNLIFL